MLSLSLIEMREIFLYAKAHNYYIALASVSLLGWHSQAMLPFYEVLLPQPQLSHLQTWLRQPRLLPRLRLLVLVLLLLVLLPPLVLLLLQTL